MTTGAAHAAVATYTRLRWVGVALFGAALLVTAAHVGLVAGGMPWTRMIPCILALGLSLSSFGTADDTALHTLRQLATAGPVPAQYAAELEQEQRRRPERMAAVHASPRASWILPLVALAVILLLGWRAWVTWQASAAVVLP